MTLLTHEDAVEWVLAGLSRRSDGQLDLHQLGPGAVGLHAESLNAVGNAAVDVVDLTVELWNDDESCDNRYQRAQRRDADDNLCLVHFLFFGFLVVVVGTN